MGECATSGPSSRRVRPAYAWTVVAYDRLYRFVHHLDTPASEVGPVLRLEVGRSLRRRRLPDGTLLRRGERIGLLHLNNARLALLRAREPSLLSAGLALRRDFFASIRALAALARDGGPLGGIPAFAATTIHHTQLRRLGFEPEPDGAVWPRLVALYQRALLSSLHPGARLNRPAYRQARRLWLSRQALVTRFGGDARPGPGRWRSLPPAA
ncbi:MAG: hypothetical protein HY359_02995 [Candidatus Rokubacteria bacterium]|nr:hypothetical protein [Candidatus Rokubacteria bacterium]